MRRYLLTPEAKQDIASIRLYLREEAGAEVALSVVRKITEAFRFLGSTPDAGHSRAELTDKPVKFWSVYSYMIIYEASARPVRILRVLHGSRDLAAILKDIAGN